MTERANQHPDTPIPTMSDVLNSQGGYDCYALAEEFLKAQGKSAPVLTENATAVAVDPTDAEVQIAGGFAGLFRSTDGGDSWMRADGDLPDRDIGAVTFAVDGTLFVAEQGDNRVVALPDVDGDGRWKTYDEVNVNGYHWYALDESLDAIWIRLISTKPLDRATAWAILRRTRVAPAAAARACTCSTPRPASRPFAFAHSGVGPTPWSAVRKNA